MFHPLQERSIYLRLHGELRLDPHQTPAPPDHYFIMKPLQLCCWRYEFAWWQYRWCITWHFALLVEVVWLYHLFWAFLFSLPSYWFCLSCDWGSLRCQSGFKSDIWPAQHSDWNIYVFFCCQKLMCLMSRQAKMSPNSSWSTTVEEGVSRLKGHSCSVRGNKIMLTLAVGGFLSKQQRRARRCCRVS